MEYKSYSDLFGSIKKGNYKKVYILHGEEPYFIDQVTTYLEENVLNEAERSFNQDVLYGIDTEPQTVMDYANQFPMMAQLRMVIVKEARYMKKLEELERYVDHPSPQTILVISHPDKTLSRVKKIMKKAIKSEDAGVFESKLVKEWDLEKWIASYANDQQLDISPSATSMLAQHLGADLKKVVNEIEKVLINIEGRRSITEDDIEKYVGISKEYNVFNLLKAFGTRNIIQQQAIAANLEQNSKKEPLIKLLPPMATYFEKLLIIKQNERRDDATLGKLTATNPYIIKKEMRRSATSYSERGLRRIYSLIVDADAKIKGRGSRRGEEGLLQELVGKITLIR